MKVTPSSRPSSSPLSDARTLAIVGRLLSGPTIRQLLLTGRSEYLAAAFRDARIPALLGRNASLLDVARRLFALLRTHYRSDYIYRSAIATKIFLGRHSPATTVLLPEFRVWQSKADLVMLNGTSVVYEIKTELDNLDRLESQLAAYAKVFDRINVVTDEGQLERVRRVVPTYVGLSVLTRSFTLSIAREARSNAHRVDVVTIVDALRKSELVALTKRLHGSVPNATPVRLFAACREVLLGRSPREVHDAMVTILKARKTYDPADFRTVPRELVSAYLESGVSPSRWSAMTKLLTSMSVQALIDGQ